jgi:hypothetical protein
MAREIFASDVDDSQQARAYLKHIDTLKSKLPNKLPYHTVFVGIGVGMILIFEKSLVSHALSCPKVSAGFLELLHSLEPSNWHLVQPPAQPFGYHRANSIRSPWIAVSTCYEHLSWYFGKFKPALPSCVDLAPLISANFSSSAALEDIIRMFRIDPTKLSILMEHLAEYLSVDALVYLSKDDNLNHPFSLVSHRQRKYSGGDTIYHLIAKASSSKLDLDGVDINSIPANDAGCTIFDVLLVDRQTDFNTLCEKYLNADTFSGRVPPRHIRQVIGRRFASGSSNFRPELLRILSVDDLFDSLIMNANRSLPTDFIRQWVELNGDRPRPRLDERAIQRIHDILDMAFATAIANETKPDPGELQQFQQQVERVFIAGDIDLSASWKPKTLEGTFLYLSKRLNASYERFLYETYDPKNAMCWFEWLVILSQNQLIAFIASCKCMARTFSISASPTIFAPYVREIKHLIQLFGEIVKSLTAGAGNPDLRWPSIVSAAEASLVSLKKLEEIPPLMSALE